MMGGNVSDGTTKANLAVFVGLTVLVACLLRGCTVPEADEPEGVTTELNAH